MKFTQSAGVSALLLSVAGALLAAGPARCATYNVTSLADDGGPGQLRAAISAANADAGSTITFQSGLSGTITLSPTLQALPTILVNTSIQGPGESLIAIDGRGTYRPFEINAPGGTVAFSGLTIQNGSDAGGTGGGGILLDAGHLALSHCTLSGNTATGNGGGLSNYDTATITNCTFLNNHGYNGGAIYNYTYSGSGGLATLVNSTLTGNSATINGGGVYDYTYSGTGGSTTLTRTMLSANSAGNNGAGLYNYSYSGSGGNAVLTNCVVTNNSGIYGGGLYDYTETGSGGTAILTNCTVAENSGSYTGGLYNNTYSGSGGRATLTNCIIYGDAGGELQGSVIAVYSDIQGGYVGGGNINADPLFINAATDLHLQRRSPCLGAGTSEGAPSTDFDGTTRPNPPSMGAFDYAASAPIAYVLWNSADGQVQVRTVNLDGSQTTLNTFGPYTDSTDEGVAGNTALWVATAITRAPDGTLRLLWTHPDGRVSLWRLDAQASLQDFAGYGPYDDTANVGVPGNTALWKAVGLSVGADGVTHLLWDHPDGRAALWNINADGSFTLLNGYGPYTDSTDAGVAGNTALWHVTGLASAPDGSFRLLWNHPDGRVMLWNVDAQGSFTLLNGYGPYTDSTDDGVAGNTALWRAVAVQVSADGHAHLLWNHPDGRLILWDVDGSLNMASYAGYGPYMDPPVSDALWRGVGLALTPAGLPYVLWDNPDGRTALWNVASDGTVAFSDSFEASLDSASETWVPTAVSGH